MSKDRNIILRVQSPEGTKRIEIRGSETTCALFEQIYTVFSLNSFAFALYKEQNQKNEIASSKTRTLNDIGLKHGDMIYLLPLNGAVLFPSSSTTVPIRKKTRAPAGEPGPSARANDEDIVDLLLYKEDGKIERGKDPKLCRHMDKSRCVNCSPLEPYDENYLREHNIKHLSFHAYIRKMTSGVDKGKFLALEDISCSIKEGCKEHLPWPKGICSKCQPNAITLNRQPYRHVDNVAFENKNIVERFLNYWRSTGQQRVGFLYGTYELHSDVPLGIRANVVAIYEPPQESGRDYNQLLPDPKDEIVENLAHNLGLRRVGWIFTDLLPEDTQKGTVKHLRNIDSHFLTAHECIMAGHFQNLHPNPCKYSSSGFFGSKFVTVCVTGDKTNQVHMEGYQVSNQCMALVRDDCLIPTKDAPELGYVRESSDKQFVPDVYYKEKDDYGNEVSRLGRPLPVEYLLVDVPASTPVSPSYTFNSDTNKRPFVIENRFLDGEIQDFNALNQYLSQFAPNEFFTAINDFHFLIYIATMDMLPMMEYMGPLLEALKEKNHEAAEEWSRSEHWATIKQLIAASSPIPSSLGNEASEANAGVASSSGQASWTCSHCTFLNTSEVNNCEMCNLPRSAA